MRGTIRIPFIVLSWLGGAAAAEPQDGAKPSSYNFDKDPPGKPPTGFTFGRTKNLGKSGKWLVEAHTDAPSAAGVLAQVDPDDTNARFPLAVTVRAYPSDVKVSVRCKAVSGETIRPAVSCSATRTRTTTT